MILQHLVFSGTTRDPDFGDPYFLGFATEQGNKSSGDYIVIRFPYSLLSPPHITHYNVVASMFLSVIPI